MTKFLSRFAVPLIAIAVLGLSFAFAVQLKNSAAFNADQKIGLAQKLGDKVPLDATFRDEQGKSVHLAQYFGKKPVLMMLIFYACQSGCPLQTENAITAFHEMQDKVVGRDYEVLSISIDPRETPALASGKKADTMHSFNHPDDWHFLTGDMKDIRRVADAVGYKFYYDPSKSQLLHPTGMFVLTPDGRISRLLYGIDYAAPIVSASIETAAKGEINVPSEPILFGCFTFDPKTGKTRLNVMRATQIAGIATVLILACSIFFMVRKYPSDQYAIGKGGKLPRI